ncbi:hypothetical protein BGZ96_005407, partial [Linnemannia gamsii]
MPTDTDVDTGTSSCVGNKPQSYAAQISTTAIYQDFAQTSASAALGDKDAQIALGDMYREGKVVQQDYQAAMGWYLRAAEQGDAIGLRRIGYLYDLGLGVAQDRSKAMEWYRKSADLGNAQAHCNI